MCILIVWEGCEWSVGPGFVLQSRNEVWSGQGGQPSRRRLRRWDGDPGIGCGEPRCVLSLHVVPVSSGRRAGPVGSWLIPWLLSYVFMRAREVRALVGIGHEEDANLCLVRELVV